MSFLTFSKLDNCNFLLFRAPFLLEPRTSFCVCFHCSKLLPLKSPVFFPLTQQWLHFSLLQLPMAHCITSSPSVLGRYQDPRFAQRGGKKTWIPALDFTALTAGDLLSYLYSCVTRRCLTFQKRTQEIISFLTVEDCLGHSNNKTNEFVVKVPNKPISIFSLCLDFVQSIPSTHSLIHSLNTFSFCTNNTQKTVKNSGTLKPARSFFHIVCKLTEKNINSSIGMKSIPSKNTIQTHRL